MARQSDKRARLMEAAKTLIHRKGFYLTTLADIADESGVPLGNVYYYFKTKEMIGEIVIQQWTAAFHDEIRGLESRTDPNARLLGFLQQLGVLGKLNTGTHKGYRLANGLLCRFATGVSKCLRRFLSPTKRLKARCTSW